MGSAFWASGAALRMMCWTMQWANWLKSIRPVGVVGRDSSGASVISTPARATTSLHRQVKLGHNPSLAVVTTIATSVNTLVLQVEQRLQRSRRAISQSAKNTTAR